MIDVNEIQIYISDITETERKNIEKCLKNLYATREGEQPLDRSFGLNNNFQDAPMNVAKNLFALEVIEKTNKYEKRVKVKEIKYKFEEGKMIPAVYLERREN